MARGRLGPNADTVEVLLDDLAHLGSQDVVLLGSAYLEDPGSEDSRQLQSIRDALPVIARGAHRTEAVRAVGDEVGRWATSVRHWLPAGVAATAGARQDLEPRMAAVRAVLDAAYAVVLADLLQPEWRDVLLAVWVDIVRDPFRAGERPNASPESHEAP
jgi:hypothetical protein